MGEKNNSVEKNNKDNKITTGIYGCGHHSFSDSSRFGNDGFNKEKQ